MAKGQLVGKQLQSQIRTEEKNLAARLVLYRIFTRFLLSVPSSPSLPETDAITIFRDRYIKCVKKKPLIAP